MDLTKVWNTVQFVNVFLKQIYPEFFDFRTLHLETSRIIHKVRNLRRDLFFFPQNGRMQTEVKHSPSVS
jgi:hypothetical protein